MRSRSTFGLSLITLVFRDGVEDYWSRQRIMERIAGVTLPPGLSPGLDPLSSPTGQILYYTLQSDAKNLRELSELQQWTVIPSLKQVPGVADVSNFGGVTTQFQLELDPQQLMRFNLSLKNVTDAIIGQQRQRRRQRAQPRRLGYVIRGIGLVQTLDDLGNIVVTQHNGTPIFVRDLGKLKLANQERHGIVGKDDINDVVEGTVLLLRGENPSRVLRGRPRQDRRAQRPPEGRRRADRALPRSHRRWSTPPSQGLAHAPRRHRPRAARPHAFPWQPAQRADRRHHDPVRAGDAFILMHHTKISANLLSLGAIDFGIIVDGAIVMIEAILRRREAKPDQPLTEADVRDAARQVARPIFFATAIIITTYMPLFAFQRIEEKLFYPMAYAVGYAQFGALAFTLLVVPGLRLPGLSQAAAAVSKSGPASAGGVVPAHAAALAPATRHRLRDRGGAAVAIVILGATVWREFLPELDEGSLWLHAELPPGISLQKATDMVAELRRVVDEFPEVSMCHPHRPQRRRHRSLDAVAYGGRCRPHAYRSWPAGETKQDLIRRIKARLDQLPGFEIAFSQPIIDSVIDKIFDPHSSLAIKVFGDDFTELRRIGKAIVGVLKDRRA